MTRHFGIESFDERKRSNLKEWEDRWVPIARLFRMFKAGK